MKKEYVTCIDFKTNQIPLVSITVLSMQRMYQKSATVPAYTSLWCCLKLINRLVFAAITMICSSCRRCCICSYRHPLIPQLGACWLAWSRTSLSIVLFIYVAELFLVHIRQKKRPRNQRRVWIRWYVFCWFSHNLLGREWRWIISYSSYEYLVETNVSVCSYARL